MAHGGHARPPRPAGRLRSKGPAIAKNKFSKKSKPKSKQHKPVSLKNQIRSAERLLRKLKDLPPQIKEVQEKRLQELKNQQELQNQLAIEHKMSLRYRKIKFFERRKIERMIRRLEKLQRTSADHNSESIISEQLAKLREDLEYVRFFPKTEKYVALFVGDNIAEVVEKREKLRQQIKDNLASAAAHGKELEETASDDDELLGLSDDDFFMSNRSNDDADADDEWTDISAREPVSSASGKATSGLLNNGRNQNFATDKARMPHFSRNSSRLAHVPPRIPAKGYKIRKNPEYAASSNTSYSQSGPLSGHAALSNARVDHSSNLSSNSEARRTRRKRRPKKKKTVSE